MAKLKRKGRHSPAGLRHIKAMRAKGYVFKKGNFTRTLASQGVERRLRRAGLTEKEIAKLR